MRPVSLHLSGFTTFRSPTDIDFTDADLFALTGPTGSGKSSIIDAICFALYGSIPRLSGVAPIVSLGKGEARVRLVFEVEGSTYTVSRLVVRQGDGAAQRDVRLEGPDLVAEGVRDVDSRVMKLLGLSFDHFTRTVVLPQGRFAAFLEDGPAARERLLKQLLDLGVYEEMRKSAAAHASRIEVEVGALDAQLHDLVVDSAQVEAERERCVRLRDLAEELTRAADEELEAKAGLEEVRRSRERIVQDTGRLAAVEAPSGVALIGAELAEARDGAEAAEKQLAESDAAVAELSLARAEAGEVAAWERLIAAHRRQADLTERARRGADLLEAARRELGLAEAEAGAAEEARTEVVRGLAELERVHAAHALRAEMSDGDRCPVCLQAVAEVPSERPPDDLTGARQAVSDAQARRDRAAESVAGASAEVAKLSALLDERTQELDQTRLELEGAPGPDDCAAGLASVRDLQTRLDEASARQAEARSSMNIASERLALARTAGERAAEALDRARDLVSGLEPPIPTRHDPAADWEALLAWRDDRRAGLTAELERVDTEIAERVAGLDRIRRTMAEKARDAGVTDLGEDVRVAVAAAIAAAETGLARLESDLEKKDRLMDRRAARDHERARYGETATLLRSNRFQQWLLEEALVGLVDFANAELAKLAGGAYSLAAAGGEFEVIDHRNAEARRSVKTLSGGETFLVSLALALALAERVVATSAIGTARIESMFLDEGFGTLDAETLDTVAAVVQELGTGERMVGLVTHVRELAEQIPVRYEVRKLPEGSTVTRVDS